MNEWDDSVGEDDVVFVYQGDPDCQAVSQLKDVSIGESFIFRGQKFTKINNYGWGFGVLNIQDEQGQTSHIHPTTQVSLFQ